MRRLFLAAGKTAQIPGAFPWLAALSAGHARDFEKNHSFLAASRKAPLNDPE